MLRVFLLTCLLFPMIAFANSNNQIPFHKKIEVTVGQSMIVHGFRGECGERPKNVDRNRTRDTRLGVLSNGKWGVTKSRVCGGLTPAIEVIFTARKKGRETITVAGEKIKVRVR